MREGTIFFDLWQQRIDIRFGLEEYYDGLHCGETLEVFVDWEWIPTRIELGGDWYLDGLQFARHRSFEIESKDIADE